jgi:hypothetical protein
MKRFLACLALASALALAATPPALAMKLVEQGKNQDSSQKASATKQSAQPPAGTIRTEDGKVYTVPKAPEESDKNKDGGAKKQ